MFNESKDELSSVVSILHVHQVSSLGLLLFDRNEQTSEVSGSETLMIMSLNHLIEEGWSVLDWLREDLKEVTLVVVIHEDLVLLKDVDVLADLNVHRWEVLS